MEGIPSITHENYLSARNELIIQERSLRRDFRSYFDLPLMKKKAEEIIRHIRRKEMTTIWSRPHEEVPHLFPGMEFLTARSLIENTELFKLLRKMPKAALLHVHMEAAISARKLLELALGHPAMHIRLTVAPSSQDNLFPVEIQPIFDPEYSVTSDIISPDYKIGTWVPLGEARNAYPPGVERFDDLIIGTLTINPIEAYKTHNTVTKIWTKFSHCHEIISGIVRFTPIWEQFIYEFFRSCIDDGIMYVEARISFLDKNMKGEDGVNDVTHDKWLEMFNRGLARIKEELLVEQVDGQFFDAKIIYTTLRWITAEELEWYLDDCLELKQKYPDTIAGFDLVGDENVYRPLKHYIEPLLRFQKRQKELGINIPFLFHAGETLGDGDSVDENIFDAILLGTQRIGHGYCLAKHPHLMQLCRERDIAVEVCPISNEVLRLTTSMPMHPLPILFNNGVPVVLATDDPTIFGNLLSHDLYQVLISSEITGLETLAVAARDSIMYSTMDHANKQKTLDIWERRWQAFVEDICAHYPLPLPN